MSQLTTEQFDKNKNNSNMNIQYFMFENQTRHQRTKDRDKNSYVKFLNFIVKNTYNDGKRLLLTINAIKKKQ